MKYLYIIVTIVMLIIFEESLPDNLSLPGWCKIMLYGDCMDYNSAGNKMRAPNQFNTKKIS